jgi:hypothetical protein
MMGRVQIVVDSFGARAYTPYDARHILKGAVLSSLRRWDGSKKCWTIDLCCVSVLANALRQAGYTVFITHPNGTPWSSPGTATRPPDQKPAADWIEQAFRDCPDRSVEKLRKNLLTVWHPDLEDGNTKLAQRINGAADARLGKRPR